MPHALDIRLTELLDKQNSTGTLTAKERREAEGLVEVSELLTLLRLSVNRPVRARK